ncbi:cytochrome C oxidase subunit IV family protein [Novosphingobium sp. 9U]|uniref:cytochrome C oxidase subunit IV family protein n=1 Tax=Novosphingobium sp. 9U TaxID=2653158 RepID=UPI0012F44D67|nr:cytochrome C oxidase subunit IV family protein [Novosphingobium sp. 9U]VWX50169.1 Uncharacterized 8.5 kDa protein in nirQ 3'region [Novosphingobium sp. 9U]
MTAILQRPITTWALLLVATALSYLAWVDPALLAPQIAGSIVIVIAMAKAWLIGMRFMELETAVLPLRLAYSAWVLVVGGVLLTMFALG